MSHARRFRRYANSPRAAAQSAAAERLVEKVLALAADQTDGGVAVVALAEALSRLASFAGDTKKAEVQSMLHETLDTFFNVAWAAEHSQCALSSPCRAHEGIN